MDPKPKEPTEGKLSGEEIVISGISGRFPLAENTLKLIDNLYNKVDMIEKYKFSNTKHPELPQYCGKIKNIDKFDHLFFRFTNSQAATFDPVGRITIEQAYSAIFDAGINPETLKGTKLGVFIGTSQSDSATLQLYNVFETSGFFISGCSKTMIANRISYWIDGSGPSYGLDYSCASSIACLQIAVERIKAGDCDSAIVGGCNLFLNPGLSVNMRMAGLLCLDGKTKCFDKNGDGYVRSDSINLMFLQKAKDAKRIYTQIYHVKGEYFSKPDSTFLPTRNSEQIEKFLKAFYSEIDVAPEAVEYLEANATGIAEADEKELVAIGNIFGKNKPIKVGCIKSNIGHTEPASGICSLTKICLSYQRGEIPANLHCNDALNEIDVRKIQVVSDNTKFGRSFTALNNFSNTGANYHVLLKGHYKPKDLNKYKSNIPYLIMVSGRLDESVEKIQSILENNPIDPEQIALLNNIFKHNIHGHTGRGYTIIEPSTINKNTCLAKGFEFTTGNSRPIWFLYSGMGSQWPTMGAELMRLPIFAATIERCNIVLQTKGIDVIKIITNDDKEIFDNILNSFVGITACQIALTEVLKSIGIVPEYIIGHSVGEIGCAYADGSLTLEETILISYARGVVSLETKMIKGKMAAIGLGHQEVRKLCPPEIDIACQNSSESTTISGPAEDVEKFVAYLTERSIFAKTVASSDIAYHSRYVANAGPSLLSKMKDVIKDPKVRSKLWLSTSFPPDRWSEKTSSYSSAEYFTHNMLNTVHFEETAKMIPDDAIVIEIAPHGLMQAIMKRSHKSCLNLSLTRRGEKNPVKFFLQAVGTLYQAGLNPDIDALYPKIDFPVSTETSVLSHFVDWDHSHQWSNENYITHTKLTSVSSEFAMSIHDDDYSFMQGCIRNGVNIFPESAVLVSVWKTLAMYNELDYRNTSVEFTNVKFNNSVILKPDKTLKLLVEIHKGKALFEVTKNNDIIATGFINIVNESKITLDKIQFNEKDYHLNVKDIYNLMSLKGYEYEGQFKSIEHTNIERNKAILRWDNNWITFLDSMLQLNTISRNHTGVSNVKLITSLSIDVESHKSGKKITFGSDKCVGYEAQVSYKTAVTKCSGVLLRGIVFDDIPKVESIPELLQIKKFLPHSPTFNVDLQTALQVNLQIISESIKEKTIIYHGKGDFFDNISFVISEIAKTVPSLNIEIISVTTGLTNEEAKYNVLLINNLCKNKIEQSICDVPGTKFIIVFASQEKTKPLPNYFNDVTTFKVGNLKVVLLEKSTSTVFRNIGGYYKIPAKQVKSTFDNMKLVTRIFNDCTTHTWVEIPSIPNKTTVQIAYFGVYINDTEQPAVIGKNVNKHGIGFSGINARGEGVMGVVPEGSGGSLVDVNFNFLWPVPKHWTLEEAATVPLPFIQAYYCLMIRENVQKRSNVFVSKGDSPFGQAVISLCLSLGCTVLTTVDTIAKKKILIKNFKKLDESHIGFTNDLSFNYIVQKATKNKLCDIVINCDRGQIRQEAMNYVGSYKTYLDVSGYDMEENNDYGMAFNRAAKTYKSVRLSNMFLPEYSSDKKKLQMLLNEGITNGSVRPLSRVIYSSNEVSRAFQLLSTNNMSSVILINMKNPKISNDSKILHRVEFSASKSYIVLCDGTELGVELIEHLIQRGAKRFLIHMKPKLMSGYFHVKYASWKNNDVIISFSSEDLNDKTGCYTLLRQGNKLGTVDGIFITQNELSQNRSDEINHDNVDISLITSNLDVASRTSTLRYLAILIYTAPDYNMHCFAEVEKCCFTRYRTGLPSLVVRYESNKSKMLPGALSKLYNAMEASLKQNYTSVFLSDSKPKSRIYSADETCIEYGLEALVSKIPEVELTATEPVISMRTHVNYEDESEIFLNFDDTYVMMIPGFDGSYQSMKTVAERLKIPAVTLQLECEFLTSIHDIAKRLLCIINKRFNMKSKFYLLGYSFGVNVALELAALLEKEGRTGVVFCLDSSPDALKDQLMTYTGNMTEQQLQNSVLDHFYKILTGDTFEDFKAYTSPTLEWSEKINILIDHTKKSVSCTHQFVKSFINAIYRRILIAKDYEPDFKLESEIVLMKGNPRSDNLCNDYGLLKYTKNPVKVFDLEADHVTAPQDIRVSNIINKMLDPGLLEEFEKKNLCQYYYNYST